jgi:hypothetical protein
MLVMMPVFYFFIFSNKLNLFQATFSVIFVMAMVVPLGFQNIQGTNDQWLRCPRTNSQQGKHLMLKKLSVS